MQLQRLQAQNQKSLLSTTKYLKDGGRFWDDVNGGYLPEDLVLVARREEIAWVLLEVSAKLPRCKHAGKKLLKLIWVDTDKSVDPAFEKKRSRLCAREYKTKNQDKNSKRITCFSVVLSYAST